MAKFTKQIMMAALASSEVKRFHMTDVVGQQDVAQHSLRVAYIAGRIAKLSLGDYDPMVAFYYGAAHDLGEVITGDVPTHTKIALRRRSADPDKLVNSSFGVLPEVPTDYKWIIKGADMIEAIVWLRDHVLSNRSKHVLAYIKKKFDEFLAIVGDERAHVLMVVMDEINEGYSFHYDLEWPHD